MRFTYEGRPIPAQPGETVAAALIRAGHPVGYFCGIGVCFGCLVTVDGVMAQRACLTPAVDGATVVPDPLVRRDVSSSGAAPGRSGSGGVGSGMTEESP